MSVYLSQANCRNPRKRNVRELDQKHLLETKKEQRKLKKIKKETPGIVTCSIEKTVTGSTKLTVSGKAKLVPDHIVVQEFVPDYSVKSKTIAANKYYFTNFNGLYDLSELASVTKFSNPHISRDFKLQSKLIRGSQFLTNFLKLKNKEKSNYRFVENVNYIHLSREQCLAIGIPSKSTGKYFCCYDMSKLFYGHIQDKSFSKQQDNLFNTCRTSISKMNEYKKEAERYKKCFDDVTEDFKLFKT